MSYTVACGDLKHILTMVGEDPTGFSQHSMKRGGATEAAHNGANEVEIAKAGDWSQLKTARKYIEKTSANNRILQRYLS